MIEQPAPLLRPRPIACPPEESAGGYTERAETVTLTYTLGLTNKAILQRAEAHRSGPSVRRWKPEDDYAEPVPVVPEDAGSAAAAGCPSCLLAIGGGRPAALPKIGLPVSGYSSPPWGQRHGGRNSGHSYRRGWPVILLRLARVSPRL